MVVARKSVEGGKAGQVVQRREDGTSLALRPAERVSTQLEAGQEDVSQGAACRNCGGTEHASFGDWASWAVESRSHVERSKDFADARCLAEGGELVQEDWLVVPGERNAHRTMAVVGPPCLEEKGGCAVEARCRAGVVTWVGNRVGLELEEAVERAKRRLSLQQVPGLVD